MPAHESRDKHGYPMSARICLKLGRGATDFQMSLDALTIPKVKRV